MVIDDFDLQLLDLVLIIVTMTAGCLLMMWIGELISEYVITP